MGCVPYQTVEDANRCLRQTICLYEGRPVHVDSVQGDHGIIGPANITIRARPLPLRGRDTELRFRLDDPRFDIAGMQLGYINSVNDAYWAERTLHQGTTQGIADINTTLRVVPHDDGPGNGNWSSFFENTGITDMFSRNYPSVQTILAKWDTSSDLRSHAFSRCFALSKDSFRNDYMVYYKGIAVAFGDIRKGGVVLNKKFTHLREQLEELGINVAA